MWETRNLNLPLGLNKQACLACGDDWGMVCDIGITTNQWNTDLVDLGDYELTHRETYQQTNEMG